MSIDTVRTDALVPEQCGMIARLRYNQQTGKAEIYFGTRTATKEVAFGMSYKECDELLNALSQLMQQVPPSRR